jgi:heme-binding NEAT domain protein
LNAVDTLAGAEIQNNREETMNLRRLAIGIAAMLCLYAPARGAMYKIENPASNIYNPAARMNNPNPLSPPTQPVPQPTVTEVTTTTEPAKHITEQPRPKSNIPQKSYYFKTVSAYINAAKKAFARDDYMELISITEDALRRINAGTLKASKKTEQKLAKYKVLGYGLLEENED